MSQEQKKELRMILIAAALFAVLLVCEFSGVFEGKPWWIPFLFALVPYLIVGAEIIKEAFESIVHGELFDENFLMMIAAFGAFAIQEYTEAVAVMLLFRVGEWCEHYATGKSRASISDLMRIAPESALVERNGKLTEVPPADVKVGETIVVRPGDRIPLDGKVTQGSSMLDTAALTGESVPRSVRAGDSVISGCVNGQGTLRICTTKVYRDSTVARILDLVEHAADKKTHVEHFVTRFAKVYTPVVTISALIIALLPPLLLQGGSGVWFSWIRRACIFLVVSCPCALVISIPLGFFGGIGAASRIGVLVKGSNFLEALSHAATVVFDKTGTLTKGEFRVTRIRPAEGFTEEDVLELAANAEQYSTHPIAESIRTAFKGTNGDGTAEEIPGCGIRAHINGRRILVGNSDLMERNQIPYDVCMFPGTVVYTAVDERFAGAIVIADVVKDGAAEAIYAMKLSGIRRTVMLTGDREEAAGLIALELGIDETHAELLPADKVAIVETLLAKESEKEKLAFVGDGINDAPVLMRSDVGIAMGSLGSDAAIEAADIVLMDDDVRKIAETIRIARRTLRIIRTNIVFAIAVKVLILILSVLGFANMWLAIFADVGVLILCILNAMRIQMSGKAG